METAHRHLGCTRGTRGHLQAVMRSRRTDVYDGPTNPDAQRACTRSVATDQSGSVSLLPVAPFARVASPPAGTHQDCVPSCARPRGIPRWPLVPGGRIARRAGLPRPRAGTLVHAGAREGASERVVAAWSGASREETGGPMWGPRSAAGALQPRLSDSAPTPRGRCYIGVSRAAPRR